VGSLCLFVRLGRVPRYVKSNVADELLDELLVELLDAQAQEEENARGPRR